MRGVSDLLILLATVNISCSKICQKIPKFMLLLAATGVVFYLGWTLVEDVVLPTSSYVGMTLRVIQRQHQRINNICHFLLTKMFATK